MRPRFLSARRGAFLSTTALAGAMLFAAVAAMPALADGGAGGNGATGGGTAGSGGAGGTGFTAPNNNGGNSTAGAGGGGAGGGGGGAAGGGHGGDGCAGLCPANGGAGGTALNPNGQDGAAGSAGGGGGGGGGYNGNGAGASTITNTSALAGGNGGAGGAAAGVNGGGGGGAGGYGAVVTGSGGSSNSASITGGNGGIGGAAGGAPGVHAGNGGDGGVGVQFTSTGATFTNSGSITGGNGGAGGSGSGGGIAGTPGAGGVGIVGAGLTVINSGTISGGLAGGGARANAITFTGGTNTLELRAGFLITGNVVAASTADTLALGGTTNASFDVSKIGSSAQYQGFGNFQKTGTSTWTLIGTTAAVTPWTINAGTLAVSSDANLGDPGGGLSFNGGTLQFLSGFTTNRGITLNAGGGTFDTNGNNGTLAGNIVGTGGLTKIGAGTLTLSGPSTYTGATNVNAGTLQAGVANAFAPLSAFTIASGATLDLNNFDQAVGSLAGAGAVTLGAATLFTGGDNTSTTFAGTISGSGALFKLGPGTLALTGTSTYSGGTMIAGGLVNFNAASNFGTGLILLNGGGLQWAAGTSTDISSRLAAFGAGGATFDTNGNNVTLASALAGIGGVTKIGAGTLVLSGIDTYRGPTTVAAGTLTVNGSIASSVVTVNAGATLSGIGTVGGLTINSGGTFAPGNSPGTMTVAGNLAFQSGALYVVQVNSTTASSTNVTGSATLAGSVQAAFASGSYATRTYTIVSAAGGLGGTTFNTLTTSNLPAGFTASLSYTATDAILNLTATLGQPSGPGLGPGAPSGPGALACAFSLNQCNVANALNAFFNNGGALPPAFVTIFGLTGANLANALTLLSGEAATGAQQVAFQLTNQFLGIMLDPFVDGRSNPLGGGAIGFAPAREELPEDIALAYAKILKEPPKPQTFEQRWSVWGAGYGGSNRTSGDPAVIGSHDLSAATAGGAAGLDYRLAPGTVLGFALAGGGTSWGLAQGLGTGKSDAFQAGVYGTARSGPAYLAAALAYTNHWMSTDRFAFAGDHLSASFNAQSFGGRVESGYRFATIYGGLTPYAAIQTQSFHAPSYNETDLNAGGFALGFNSRNATDTRSELGGRFDRLLLLNPEAALTLRTRVAWAHDWISDPSLAAAFQTLPGASFVVNGATPAKNSALTSAGAELRLANGVVLLAKFDGEFASHASTYAGTGTVRYTW
jgi:autotransporter-associated beta strand protein